MTRRTKWLIAAKVLFSASLLYLVVSRLDTGEILARLAKVDVPLFLGAYALMVCIVALSARRWQLFAPTILDFGKAFRYSWIGVFYGHVLPGAVAGDVAKGVSLAVKDRDSRTTALPVSIIADKVLGLLVLGLYFFAACVTLYVSFGDAVPALRRVAAVLLVLMGIGILFTAGLMVSARRHGPAGASEGAGRIARMVGAVQRSLLFAVEDPARAWKALGLSAAIHGLNIAAFYLSLRALDIPAGLGVAAVAYPVLSVVMIVPVSISGIGVREATLVPLFALFGLDATAAVATSWLALIAAVPNILIGATLQMMEMVRK